MSLKEHKTRIIESAELEVEDYKGDMIDVVSYQYYKEIPIEVGIKDEVKEDSYTKDLGDGKKQSKVYSTKTFHEVGSNWHLVEYGVVEKSEWDNEM